jgi:hypothetical protein
MAEPNSVWQQPTPVVDRSSIAVQAFNKAEYDNHTVDPQQLEVERQWRQAKADGTLRNHGASINTDETAAAR